MRRIAASFIVLVLSGFISTLQGQVPAPIHGVTVEDTHDVTTEPFQTQVVTALGNLTVGPTTRIVFTPPRPAGDYQAATARISTVSYTMGLPVDSSSMSSISVSNYLTRFKDYVATLGSNVDIWEICNECNGDWLGNSSDVAAKLAEAYDYVKGQGKVAALTLYQFPTLNSSCVSNPSYDMLTWAKKDSNVPQRIKQGVDYVLVSYYNDSCSPPQPEPNWKTLFANLAPQSSPMPSWGLGKSAGPRTLRRRSRREQPSSSTSTGCGRTYLSQCRTTLTVISTGNFRWIWCLGQSNYGTSSTQRWRISKGSMRVEDWRAS